jgi:MFS family permease
MLRRLPRGVYALGAVSLFMDISSEMIHALLPLFLVSTLGASPLVLGAITGAGEAAVALVKLFSGAISDWLGRRKPLLLLGYGLAAATKPFFALAASAGGVFALHLADRIGKGIRGAPRDALVADLTLPAQRGAAYGLRQSMDTVGAFIGPLLAMLLMGLYSDNIRAVFAWAIVPALIAVGLIVAFVRDAPAYAERRTRGFPIQRAQLARLPKAYWHLLLLAALMSLARIPEAFLLLRGSDVGLAPALVPVVLLGMNLAYAASAYPFGSWSDGRARAPLLAGGIAMLALAHGALAVGGLTGLAVGVLLWGLHLGATQGLLAAMVADHCPADLCGTAFGVLNVLMAGMTLLGSILAGALWSLVGPVAAFGAAAVLAVVALAVAQRQR